MSRKLHVRRYRSDDADAIWAVHEWAFRASPLEFVEDAPADADLRQIRSAYLDAGGEFLVGCIEPRSPSPAHEHLRAGDGEEVATGRFVVATGGFVPAEDGAVEIRRMRVDPDHQRNGFGATILSSLEEAARRRGYDRAVLETHELLAAAQHLYESRGYRETGREEGRDGHDRVQYATKL